MVREPSDPKSSAQLNQNALDALEDFRNTLKHLNCSALDREKFVSVLRDSGFSGNSNEIFDELCKICSAATGDMVSEIDDRCIEALYSSIPYSEGNVGSEAGSALVGFVEKKFRQFDTAGAGFLTPEGVEAMLHDMLDDSVGQELLSSNFNIHKFVRDLDIDGNGEIDLNELTVALLNIQTSPDSQEERVQIPPSFNITALDPSLTSADDFVTQVENLVLEHRSLEHHFLTSLATAAFGDRTYALVHRYMLCYQHFSRKFVSYVSTLKNLLTEDSHREVMEENEAEEKGHYSPEELQKMQDDFGVPPESFNGVPHPELFSRCADAVFRAAQSTCYMPALTEEQVSHVAEPLVKAFDHAVSKAHKNVAKCLGALYFASELIVPILYSKILGGLKLGGRLSMQDLAFYILHVEMDIDHADRMRSVVVDFGDTQSARTAMLRTALEVMEARSTFLDRLVQSGSMYNDSEIQLAIVPNDKLYDAQSQNWVRKEAKCLSDFTGRPLVFKVCEPHLGKAVVLDIGCGEGYVSRKMVEMGARLCVGVDVSEGMVNKAKEMAGAKERYIHGDATQLCSILTSNPSVLGALPGVDLDTGIFDMAVGCFVFNYVTINQMNKIAMDTFSLLKPGGHFVFSVPHPLMLFMSGGASSPSAFEFDRRNLEPGQYFSIRDMTFAGTIMTTDGKALNVKMLFKTIQDYCELVSRCGFELVDLHEARVQPEHMQHNPKFFDTVKDMPLHLIFKVKKPTSAANLSSANNHDLLPKKIVWTPTTMKHVETSVLVTIPPKAQEQLAEVTIRCHSKGVTAETFEMSLHAKPSELTLVAAFAAEVRHRLLVEVGAVLVRGLDMEKYGGMGNVDLMTDRSKLAYYIFCSLIGKVDAQARGRLFDVRDTKLDVKGDNVLFSVANTEAGWHTDGASRDKVYDVVSLLCCVPAAKGGEFKISNGVNALENLKLKAPKWILYELMRPLPRDVLESGAGKGVNGIKLRLCRSKDLLQMRIKHNSYPIYVEQGDRLKFRYMRFWIETAHTKIGWPVSPLLRLAMDLLDAELDRGCIFEQAMRSGDMVFSNNLLVAHARNAFEDAEGCPPRHKVRAWLQIQKAQLADQKQISRHRDSRRTSAAEHKVPKGRALAL